MGEKDEGGKCEEPATDYYAGNQHCVMFLCHLFFYSYYFQLLAVGTVLSRGYLGIIRFFGWKNVAIITQNENVYSVVRGGGGN